MMMDSTVLNPIDEKDMDKFNLDQLIEYAQQQGYLTSDEIYEFVPEAETNEHLLEEVLEELSEAGISYVDEEDETEEIDSQESLESQEIESTSISTKQHGRPSLEDIETNDMVRLYMTEAANVPLLTAEEEKELSERIEMGRLAQQELAHGKVSQKRLKELRHLIEAGWSAREHLINANTRLVMSVARKYLGRGLPFLDLVQEGNIGLMRAAKKYDYHRGYKFSTYATWWIRQAITRALADQSRTIRLPVHMGDQINRLLRTQHRLQQQLGRVPSVEELADELEVPEDKVKQMFELAQLPLSLETPIGDEEDDTLGEFVEDNEAPDPEELTTHALLQRDLDQLLEELPPRELRVLQLRYGLLGDEPLTLKEVGKKMGITRERVRQLEAQAFSRLRSQKTQQKLHAYTE
jgi:RNA polymerase primary sigma factor